MQYSKLALLALVPGVSAFAPSAGGKTVSALKATVDPSTVTKKEYEDICGVSFDDESLEKRLERTSFLYPKHVEVVEDLAPMVDDMVDNIVSVKHISLHSLNDTIRVMNNQNAGCHFIICFIASNEFTNSFTCALSFLRLVRKHGNHRITFLIWQLTLGMTR